MTSELPKTADAVVVGGGTVGAWCAYFLRRAGLENVVLIEKGVLGQGASSRAAGVVRVQGGTPEAVRLGRWSRVVLPRAAGRARHRLRVRPAGVPAALLHAARGRGGARADRDAAVAGAAGPLADLGRGRRDQPDDGARVHARRDLLRRGRVHHPAAERRRVHGGAGGARRRHRRADAVHRARRSARLGALRRRSATVQTSRGPVSAGLVVLAGGPQLAAVGALAGISIPAGGVRHTVAVTEEHPAFADTPMAFDVPSGLYWRPEEGGLLFGMSDPDEPPGENRCLDFDYLALMRAEAGRAGPAHGRARPAAGVVGDDRLHARSPADHRRRARSCAGGRGVGRRGRHDVGARRRALRGRRRPRYYVDGGRGRFHARPRPVRRLRPQ